MTKRRIKDCTLFVADTYNYGKAVQSIKKSMEQCEFDEVVFCTNIPLQLDGVRVVQIPALKGKDGYSHFMMKDAYKHINTKFVLVAQHDSWILDSEQFDERLYDYDYAGALWLENDGLANGNGGLSFRSLKLMKATGEDNFIIATSPEDVAICRVYRHYLELTYGLKWATDEICEQFSFELRCPTRKTFAFHSYFHQPYQPTVVITRKAACGDVVQVEPVMRYFHDKGYRVVLETTQEFYLLFLNHDFKVHKINEIDRRLLDTATIINLDGSYESMPKDLHLESYFRFAGVPKEEYLPYLKSPKLSLGMEINDQTKFIKTKYAILNIDNNRAQGGRRHYGIEWAQVADHLNNIGYTVIQLGLDKESEIYGVTQINCTNINFLCYVCAGASLMVGIDSGIANICSGFDVPSVILFGNVDPKVIHPDWGNKIAIHNHDGKGVCDKPFCWGSEIGTTGAKCYLDLADPLKPPCSIFTTKQVIDGINKLVDN